jgi:hypothetical protein
MRKLLGLLAIMAVGPVAIADDDQQGWEFQLTPYLWLPTIGGDLNYDLPPGGGGAPSIDVGPTDWLDLLNGAFLINGEMRKGRFSIFTDFVYLGLESDNDKVKSVQIGDVIPVDIAVNLSTKTEFDGLSWTLAAGYTVQKTETSSMDLFAGVRYFGTDASTSWNLSVDITGPGGGVVLPAQGSIGKEADLWDGIVGVRGRLGIGASKWSVPYYADVGTGSSDLTWQAMTGLTYSYGWGDLMLVFRHLEYDEGQDGLLEGFSFSGPAFGARFRF